MRAHFRTFVMAVASSSFVMIAALVSVVVSSSASAQMDPSSALLLNGDARTQTLDSGLDSGRYKVRAKSESSVKQEPRIPARKVAPDSATPAAAVAPTPPPPSLIDPNAEPPTPVLVQLPVDQKEEKAEVPPAATPVPVAAKAKDYDLGRRLNLLELSIAPGFAYINSDSSYYYRRYSVAAPVISADAHVWFTPNFAVQVSYLGTLSGQVTDSFNGTKNAPVSQEWITAGIRSRKFFGSYANAPTLSFGIDYYDYQFNVPGDAATRESLESSGVQLALEAEIPVNAFRVWTIAFTFSPKLNHQEKSTAINFQSGGSVDANAVGLSIGGRLQFEREDAVFWKISESLEKDLFSGQASAPDPVSGNIVSGVAVTNSVTLIQFGYTWGH